MDQSTNTFDISVESYRKNYANRFYYLLEKFSRQFSLIKGPVILFILVEIIDGLLTTWATNNGFSEVNPLVTRYSQTWLYPVSKFITAIVGAIVLLPAVRRYSKLIRKGFIVAALFVALIIVTNLYEMAGRLV